MSFLFGPKVEQADVKEVADALPKDGGVLVDVREPHEWRSGHAPAAKHIPLQQLPAQLSSLPKDAPIYLICRSGNRSHTAAAFLQRNGFERPVNVRGGMIAWQRAGLPIEK
jgi:rhodanese-related sulfurtransferase